VPRLGGGADAFSSLGRLAVTGTARSGRTELVRRGIADITEFGGGVKINGPVRATIPVYFHVITDGPVGAVSDAAIAEQVDVLNLSFGGFYGGVGTGFSFELARVNRTDNAAWFDRPGAHVRVGLPRHGDDVDDTPYMSEPSSGCPVGKGTCTRGSGTDPIHNYMDYSDDPCYNQFTAGLTGRTSSTCTGASSTATTAPSLASERGRRVGPVSPARLPASPRL
jgi:hypothetical protein